MDRIAQLRQFVAARPAEPFPRYALALELKGTGDDAGAAAELSGLVQGAPDYLPAYLQLGVLLQGLGRIDEARNALRKGQDVAQRLGNSHTLGELTTALEQLG